MHTLTSDRTIGLVCRSTAGAASVAMAHGTTQRSQGHVLGAKTVCRGAEKHELGRCCTLEALTARNVLKEGLAHVCAREQDKCIILTLHEGIRGASNGIRDLS